MDAYIFQAALLCSDCGQATKDRLDAAGLAPDNPEAEYTFDSDTYPKGPYADGGGEADSPQHCDQCGVFLENPLTPDGQEYVRQAAAENFGHNAIVRQWREFYDYLATDEDNEA